MTHTGIKARCAAEGRTLYKTYGYHQGDPCGVQYYAVLPRHAELFERAAREVEEASQGNESWEQVRGTMPPALWSGVEMWEESEWFAANALARMEAPRG